MMTQMKVLLLLTVAIVPALNGYPLEEPLESSKQVNSNELKVNPLLSTQIDGQQKNANSSNDNQSKEDDNPTESTYIEETYIEVLLPGTPQLNASALASLLNISVANHTYGTNSTNKEQDSAEASSEKTNASENDVKDRSTRDVSSENDDDDDSKEQTNSKQNADEHDSADTSAEKTKASSSEKIVAPALYAEKNVNGRPTRDASSENDDDSKEQTNLKQNVYEHDSGDTSAEKTNTSSSEKLVAPALYSGKNVNDRPKRDASSENDDDSEESENSNDSDESSSKEQVNEQHGLAGQSLAPRLRRSTNEKDKQHSDEKSNESKYESASEKVVYVTPRNQNLQGTKKEP